MPILTATDHTAPIAVTYLCRVPMLKPVLLNSRFHPCSGSPVKAPTPRNLPGVTTTGVAWVCKRRGGVESIASARDLLAVWTPLLALAHCRLLRGSPATLLGQFGQANVTAARLAGMARTAPRWGRSQPPTP